MSAQALKAPALTPPMGWNSYDAYSYGVTQAQFMQNAHYVATNLKQYGWQYCVVDFIWWIPDQGAAWGVNQSGNWNLGNLDAYGRFLPRRRVIEGGLIALSVLLAILSGSGPIARFLQSHSRVGGVDVSNLVSLLSIVIVIAFLAGIAYAFVAIPAQTQLQEELDEDVRGRVFGVLNTLVSVASFLPILIAGPVSDAVGPTPVLLFTAVLIGIAGVGSIIAVHPAYAASAVPAARIAPVDPVTVVEEYDVDMYEEGRRVPPFPVPDAGAAQVNNTTEAGGLAASDAPAETR
jgi:MFS family permease